MKKSNQKDGKRPNRYTAIVAAAKRARQLIDGAPPLVEIESIKPVTIAIEELKAGKVRWTVKKKEAK